jgi:hypothetical protein
MSISETHFTEKSYLNLPITQPITQKRGENNLSFKSTEWLSKLTFQLMKMKSMLIFWKSNTESSEGIYRWLIFIIFIFLLSLSLSHSPTHSLTHTHTHIKSKSKKVKLSL